MMAGDLMRMLDPTALAAEAGYPALDPWQARLLWERPRRSLLCCSRQSGKSTITALIALYVALYEAPALILLVSPAQRQSAELFRCFMTAYHNLKDVPPLVQESVLRCEFANGSRVIALPSSEKTLRGFAKVDLCVIDEAARCPDELQPTTTTRWCAQRNETTASARDGHHRPKRRNHVIGKCSVDDGGRKDRRGATRPRSQSFSILLTRKRRGGLSAYVVTRRATPSGLTFATSSACHLACLSGSRCTCAGATRAPAVVRDI